MNEKLKLNLQDLHMLHLVHYHQNITAAAKAIGIGQSALSRRLKTIELEIGLRIFTRTTRSLTITEAGAQLLRDTASIPNILDSALQRLAENHLGSQSQIKIGISSSLSLAHMPGIFQRQFVADVKIIISQIDRKSLLRQVNTNQLDLGILTHQQGLDKMNVIHHQLEDRFCIILPTGQTLPSLENKHFKKWAAQQSWILPKADSVCRGLLDEWFSEKDLDIVPTMELDNFDLMCQLVALEMGVAFIPKRALTVFPRKQQLHHTSLKSTPKRTISVIGPKNTIVADHVKNFIDSILFS